MVAHHQSGQHYGQLTGLKWASLRLRGSSVIPDILDSATGSMSIAGHNSRNRQPGLLQRWHVPRHAANSGPR